MIVQPKFCIITPSYTPDFERCRLLCHSIDKFIFPVVKHYIIVDQRDLKLFKQLESSTREIITKESILPWWIKRLPIFTQKNIWLSLKTVPLRGWLIQQLTKMAIAQYIQEDVLIFIDSDVAFVRPFDLQKSLVQGEKIRFFQELNSIPQDLGQFYQWFQTISQLLQVPMTNFPAHNYVCQIVTWKRDNVFKLYETLEKHSNRHWIETFCNCWNISEYVLYGVFVDQVLGDQSGHFYDQAQICHHYWREEFLSSEDLKRFILEIEPYQVAVMISAKANISISQYENLFQLIPQI
jgi:hypothetical protein